MNTQLILSNIQEVVPLSGEETELLESLLIPRPFKQGETIVKAGEPARFILFVNAGYLMTYYTDKEDTDHVIRFAASGWWAGDIHTIDMDTETLYSTKGLCDGEVLLLPRLAQSHLLKNHIHFERYFRILFQQSLRKQQLRFIESYCDSAEKRYQTFIQVYPGIEQYVPQKYIASYLGITPEFLSKIRRRLSQK